MTEDYVARMDAYAKEHAKNDGCDCKGEAFPCPNKCGGTAAWDEGVEGHICSRFQAGCDYYDGVK